MARGAGKKDKFADLDSEFKDAVASMTETEIRNKISTVALAQMEVEMKKKADQALQEAVEKAKIAAEGYKESTKMNKLRMKFCRRVLADQGKISSEFTEESA